MGHNPLAAQPFFSCGERRGTQIGGNCVEQDGIFGVDHGIVLRVW